MKTYVYQENDLICYAYKTVQENNNKVFFLHNKHCETLRKIAAVWGWVGNFKEFINTTSRITWTNEHDKLFDRFTLVARKMQ